MGRHPRQLTAPKCRRAPLWFFGLFTLVFLSGGCDATPGLRVNNADPTFTPQRLTATEQQTNSETALLEQTSTPAAILLTPSPTAGATESNSPGGFSVQIGLDTTKLQAISPLIYGISNSGSGDEDKLKWLGVDLLRWGGNARSMYNWEVNASNAGSDWEFRNVSQGDNTPGSASLLFLQRNQRLGAQSIMTIPTLGWVAKDGNNDNQSVNVPAHGGPAVSKNSESAFTQMENGLWINPYDPTANRARTSVQSFPSKGAPFIYPPNLTDSKVYQDEWVAYLRSMRPQGSPPPIYAMDNEPELWADSTHVDVRPVRLGYDDELSLFLTYAQAVKKADPQALVIGPESWGVTAYLYSALDEGGDGYSTSADRKAHNGMPFIEWFLKAVRDSDQATGSRSLDALTVHYYPNAGEYTGGNSPDMQDKRMQAPRALWDGTYIEPSWVARTEWPNLALVPRLKKLIDQQYPGTKLGITEWNFGGEDDISGAIATADTLGIFGREGVYLASFWGDAKQGSPTGWAFRLYRNYDGKGSAFGGKSVATTNSNSGMTSAYSALDSQGRLTIMLINKDRSRTAEMKINTGSFGTGRAATLYRYGQADLSKIKIESLEVTDPAAIKVSLAPLSVALLVLGK
ncbi:MAG: glycoside hydrolase family 44 protein [Chloroflexi bacterium]|nr:glycoside hydrolase family 44 protein [Chloroflexota bacterium]